MVDCTASLSGQHTGIDDPDNFTGRREPGAIRALHFNLAARLRRAPAARLWGRVGWRRWFLRHGHHLS